MRNEFLIKLLSGAALVLGMACGGGSTPTPPPKPDPNPTPTVATKLVYTEPTSGDYRLVKDASSTDAHLVLNLLGPAAGIKGRGVAFYLNVDASMATWGKVASSDAEYAKSSLFTDVVKTKVNGGTLQVGSFQKGQSAAAVAMGPTTVLAHVALDLKSGLTPGAITLSAPAVKAVLIPETGDALTPFSITTGTLQAQ